MNKRVEGKYYALNTPCPHQGFSLAKGDIEDLSLHFDPKKINEKPCWGVKCILHG